MSPETNDADGKNGAACGQNVNAKLNVRFGDSLKQANNERKTERQNHQMNIITKKDVERSSKPDESKQGVDMPIVDLCFTREIDVEVDRVDRRQKLIQYYANVIAVEWNRTNRQHCHGRWRRSSDINEFRQLIARNNKSKRLNLEANRLKATFDFVQSS